MVAGTLVISSVAGHHVCLLEERNTRLWPPLKLQPIFAYQLFFSRKVSIHEKRFNGSQPQLDCFQPVILVSEIFGR
jgi:hypothetical protein